MITATDTISAYIECALWASVDDDGDPLDSNPAELAPETITRMHADVAAFAVNCADLDLSDLDPAQIGHDLWLTRNHHGAGFWDRGLGTLGDTLTERADAMGECDLYIGDDGLIYAA